MVTLSKFKTTAILSAVSVFGILSLTSPATAHPGKRNHVHVMKKPIAGVYNNLWYDYRSDTEEAENELRKDLRDARRSGSDRKRQKASARAWAEYNNELTDARKDYRKEMMEKGHLRRGDVTVY